MYHVIKDNKILPPLLWKIWHWMISRIRSNCYYTEGYTLYTIYWITGWYTWKVNKHSDSVMQQYPRYKTEIIENIRWNSVLHCLVIKPYIPWYSRCKGSIIEMRDLWVKVCDLLPITNGRIHRQDRDYSMSIKRIL